jgi:hypothetical protein
MNKTYIAFWTCRDMFRRTWRLRPELLHWIYNVAARLIAICDVTVWWPGVKFKTSKVKLCKLQRMVSFGITGAMRTAPTPAVEVLFRLPTLHLQLEAEVRAGNYSLYCSNQWKPNLEVLDMYI